jgi:hypothetical protein
MEKPPIYITSKGNHLLKPNVTEPEAAYELPGLLQKQKESGTDAAENSRRNTLW